MKKMFMKFGFQTMLAAFFLVGGLLLSGSASAQGSIWKTPGEAINVLKLQVENYHQVLGNTTPGTGVYDNALRHAAYYKGIISLVSNGETVQTATTTAVYEAVNVFSDPSSIAAPVVDRTVLNALVAEATDLLTD